MKTSDMNELDASGSPLLGLIRLVGSVALTLIAGVGVLVVLDILPESMLSTLAVKVGLVTMIIVATAAVVTLLWPSRRR